MGKDFAGARRAAQSQYHIASGQNVASKCKASSTPLSAI